MRLSAALCISLLLPVALFAQTVKTSIEFHDTLANKKVGEIGYVGNAGAASFFVEANDVKKLIISNDTLSTIGTVVAKNYIGDGSKLTGIAIDSIGWDRIRNIPLLIRNLKDTVNFAKVADTAKNVAAGSVTATGLAAGAVTNDKITSVDWTKITNAPVINGTVVKDSVGKADTANFAKSLVPAYVVPAGQLPTTISGLPATVTGLSTKVTALESAVPTKADTSTVYKKVDTYTKTEVNSLLTAKASTSDLTTGLTAKANAATTYAKTETDAKLALKADATSLTNLNNGVAYASSNTDVMIQWSSGGVILEGLKLTINAPSDGYLVVTATGTIKSSNIGQSAGPVWSVKADLTYDSGVLSNDANVLSCSNIAGASAPFSITKGYPVTNGLHDLRLLLIKATSQETLYLSNPSITVYFSAKNIKSTP
jgi:hypothetical protein